MPAPRKPKKVFVQFAVALVVAAVFGLGALIFGLSVITNIQKNADQTKQEAQKIKAEAEAKLESLKAEQAKLQEQPVKVIYKTVQAAVDIQPGQPITKEMVTLTESDQTPSQTALTMLSQAVGKMVKSPVIQGETLEQGKILDGAGLVTISPGMRAMTIQVSNVGSVNNSLTAGSRVDILTTVTNNDKTITRTLLQNVKIIAASNDPASATNASSSRMDSGNDGSVTVAVTPKQAELLTLANQLGKFHLTLRNYNDEQTVKMPGADLGSLMAGLNRMAAPKKAMPAKPPEPTNGFHNVNLSRNGKLPAPGLAASRNKFTMQIYRGSGTETVEFQQ